MAGLPFFSDNLKGQCLTSRLTSASPTLRPIKRFASKTVFEGLLGYAFFALSPILEAGMRCESKTPAGEARTVDHHP
jgi:hypothetical protein